MEMCISAPGKVLLFGEHSVVYGRTAIASAISPRTFVCFRFQPPGASSNVPLCSSSRGSIRSPGIRFVVPELRLTKEWSMNQIQSLQSKFESSTNSQEVVDFDLLQSIHSTFGEEHISITSFLYLFYALLVPELKRINANIPSLEINVSSSVPTAAGVGSSAAFGVCLSTTLLILCGKVKLNREKPESSIHYIAEKYRSKHDFKSFVEEKGKGMMGFTPTEEELKLINKWAYVVETLIHKKPSGIDNSISTYGGMLSFQKGVISHINKPPPIQFMVINTKTQRNSYQYIQKVRELFNQDKEGTEKMFDQIENIVQTFLSMCGKDIPPSSQLETKLGNLVTENHRILQKLNVSHPSIEAVREIVGKYGLPAKLTGAGGGGSVLALLNSGVDFKKVKESLEAAQFDCFQSEMGPGVLIHQGKSLSFNQMKI